MAYHKGIATGVTVMQSKIGSVGSPRVVRLTVPIRLLVPALLFSSLPKRAIGFSFERGRFGAAVGSLLLASGLLVGYLLFPLLGAAGLVASFWLLGTTGAVMLFNSWASLAFVKPLCRGCRLMPVIARHESLHLAGIASDDQIWSMVSKEVSFESLALGDASVCSFCPIAKRLKH